ncbi:hypothetical protein B1R32_110105 [Abditibacterium utsteinense]|uniref:Uncharacterized protein n=1 Tax=Abditibacterium utsteinense TaxID=1960156 RepID=A0A2S8SSC5_9BACT|nr:hypothetical protein B1R32_110105 [Abditibacterium utsteinense]
MQVNDMQRIFSNSHLTVLVFKNTRIHWQKLEIVHNRAPRDFRDGLFRRRRRL